MTSCSVPSGSPRARRVHELDRPVEAAGGRDLVEPEPDGLLEARAAVGLREVEQQPDEDGRGGYLHGGGVFWVDSARVNTVWACLFSRTSCKRSRNGSRTGSRSTSSTATR